LLGIMTLKASGIDRPRQLVGNTVGYPGIPSQEAYLQTMLETDGAKMSDVDLVNVGFDLTPALVSGRVDASLGAYWTHETIVAEREGYPVNLMRVEDWGVPSYYELVMTASESTVRQRADTVRRFLAAMERGYLDAIADPAAALDALAEASPDLDRAVEAEGLRRLIPAWTEGGVRFGTQTAERWNDYAAWMARHDLIPTTLDVPSAWTAALMPPAGATPTANANRAGVNDLRATAS
jgi:putative hydroxymethylpyrimidine transport system substrate-binding protein